MGGHGSGRYTHKKEYDVNSLLDVSFPMLLRYLKDDNVAIEKRITIAKDFCLKFMPERVEQLSLSVNVTPAQLDKLISLIEYNHSVTNRLQQSDNNVNSLETDCKGECGGTGGGVLE